MHKFWLFIAALSIVASQSRAEGFDQKKDAFLKKAGIHYNVRAFQIDDMQSPMLGANAQDNNLNVTLRKDLVNSCSNDELLFFILSLSIAHKKIEELGWKLYIPFVGMFTTSVTTASALTTTFAYKCIKPDALSKENVLYSMFAPVLGAFFGLHGNIAALNVKRNQNKPEKTWKEVIILDSLAPLAGVLIGALIARIGITKYVAHLINKGDKPAAALIGYDTAISALNKAKRLPVSDNSWFSQTAQGMIYNFENRALALALNNKLHHLFSYRMR